MGLRGHTVDDNLEFMEYFDKILIPSTLGKNVTVENDNFIEYMKMHSDNSSDTMKTND